MILEAPAHQPDAIGQQGRGQSVARMARIDLAIKTEIQRLAAVNQAPSDAIVLCHVERPSARATSRANSTFVILWVTVFRVTTSQLRSPCS